MAFLFAGIVTAVHGSVWAFGLIGTAVGFEISAPRLHRWTWAGLNVPDGPVPTPPAVTALRGAVQLVVIVVAAAAVAGHDVLGAFLIVLFGAASTWSMVTSLVRRARSKTLAPATAAAFHSLTAACCFALAATLSHLDAAAFVSYLGTALILLIPVALLMLVLRLATHQMRRSHTAAAS